MDNRKKGESYIDMSLMKHIIIDRQFLHNT